MRLVLVISSLGGGGAERVMTLLANGWTRRGIDVSLITIGSASDDRYELDPNVNRIGLDSVGRSNHALVAVINNFRRIRALRAAIRDSRADVVLSFVTSMNVLSLMAAKPLGIPVIVSERVWPEAVRPGAAWRYLRTHTYRHAAAVIAQTHRAAEWLKREIPDAIVDVITNPVETELQQSPDEAAELVLASCLGCDLVIAAGRLCEQKGFDMLIRAFASLAPRWPDWRLAIFGEGPTRRALLRLCEELDIKDRVLFPGFSRAIQFMMQKAGLFVLSSRYEGMPNALAEAMACGAACISFDCLTGPAELISHEQNGLLVPAEDVSGLGGAMERLMQDEALRRRLGAAAQKDMIMFSVEKVLNRWDAVIAKARKAADLNEGRSDAWGSVSHRG